MVATSVVRSTFVDIHACLSVSFQFVTCITSAEIASWSVDTVLVATSVVSLTFVDVDTLLLVRCKLVAFVASALIASR